jgi:SAM-dependent methyltransferase
MTGDATWLDSMPEIYDRCLGQVWFGPYAEYLADLVGKLAPQDLLEIAAGTGQLTRALVSALPAATITATDLNPAMVEWGAAHSPAAQWRQADALELPFRDADFDLAVCQFGVMFFPDRPRALGEVARVLRPGGTFVFTTWDAIEHNDIARECVAALGQVLEGPVPDFLERVPHGYHDTDQIRSDVIAGGLEPVAIERVRLRGTADSAAAVAEGLCCGTPYRFELAAIGDVAEIAARMAAQLTERIGLGPVAGELSAFVVSARSTR